MSKRLTKQQLESIDTDQIESYRYLKGQFENLSLDDNQTLNIKIMTATGETTWIMLSTKNHKDVFKALYEAKNLLKGDNK